MSDVGYEIWNVRDGGLFDQEKSEENREDGERRMAILGRR